MSRDGIRLGTAVVIVLGMIVAVALAVTMAPDAMLLLQAMSDR